MDSEHELAGKPLQRNSRGLQSLFGASAVAQRLDIVQMGAGIVGAVGKDAGEPPSGFHPIAAGSRGLQKGV